MSSPLRRGVQLALLSVAGYAGISAARAAMRRLKHGRPAAIAPHVADETMGSEDGYVRPAGRSAMRDPYRRWDRVDEASDESFPASDPPASY